MGSNPTSSAIPGRVYTEDVGDELVPPDLAALVHDHHRPGGVKAVAALRIDGPGIAPFAMNACNDIHLLG